LYQSAFRRHPKGVFVWSNAADQARLIADCLQFVRLLSVHRRYKPKYYNKQCHGANYHQGGPSDHLGLILRGKFAFGDLPALLAFERSEGRIEQSTDQSSGHLSATAVAPLNRFTASWTFVGHIILLFSNGLFSDRQVSIAFLLIP
jgi:hypothetical protein